MKASLILEASKKHIPFWRLSLILASGEGQIIRLEIGVKKAGEAEFELFEKR
jgi:hypothetical protein